MSSEWKEYLVEDIALNSPHAMATGPFGSSISAKFFQDDGVPVIRGGNLSADIDHKMSDEGLVFISEDKAAEFTRSIVRSGDLVFTCWGTINQVGLITDDLVYSEYVISNKQMKLTVDPQKADSLFIYYVFSSPTKQAEILSNGIGAAVPGFNLGQLKKQVVYLPPLEMQKKISSFLSCFDKKIQLNRQINQTLEQMAQAIFQSWFVDFEPVKAKITAREDWLARQAAQSDAHDDAPQFSSPVCYAHEFADAATPAPATQADLETFMNRAAMCAISGKTDADLDAMPVADYQRLYHTASLFPDELVESELGEIPKGWDLKFIGDIADVVKGKSYKSEELSESQNALVTLKSFSRGGGYRLDGLKEYIGKYKPEQVVVPGDLIIAYTDVTQAADVIGKPAMVISDSRYENLIISLDVSVVRPKVENLKVFLYAMARTDQFQTYTRSYTTGTTVLHLAKEAVPNYLFVSPDDKLLNAYSDQVKPMFKQIDVNIQENSRLERLRDALLPKLLSGELDISALTDLADHAAEPGAAHV